MGQTCPFSAPTHGTFFPMALSSADPQPSRLSEAYLIPMCAIGASSTVAEILATSSTAVNVANGCGWTPLTAAAFAGQTKVAALLIESGARINQLTPHGDALKVACRQGNAACAELLLEAGACVDTATLVECNAHQDCAVLVKRHFSYPSSAVRQTRGLALKAC